MNIQGKLVSLAWILATATIASATHAASPPSPEDSFQQELRSVRSLQFARNTWWWKGNKLQDLAPVIITNNDLTYATVELYGEDLESATEVEFLDVSGTTIVDVVSLPAGTGHEVSRTLPIVTATIRIRITHNGSSVGKGRVVVGRAFGPAAEGDRPESLTAGLPLLSLFAHDPASEKTKLSEVGRAIAFIQIAEPTVTNGCTGFLIERNLVATAAHCLRTARAAELGASWTESLCRRIGLVFDMRSSQRVPGSGDNWSTHCKSIVYLDATQRQATPGHGIASGYDLTDIALLAVDSSKDTASGALVRSPLSVGSVQRKLKDTLVTIIQHPQGQPERVARDCIASESSVTPLFLHHCATAPGSSGAPVLYYDGTDWLLVGMHTCCADQLAVSSDTPDDLRDALKLVNAGIDISELHKAMTSSGAPSSNTRGAQ